MNSLEKSKQILNEIYDNESHPNESYPKENLVIMNKFLRRVAAKTKPRTLNNNYASMIAFSRWCTIPIPELTEDDALDLLDYLKNHTYVLRGEDVHYSPFSIHTHLILIKKFFAWYATTELTDKEKREVNRIIEILKQPKPEPNVEKKSRKNLLTSDEVELLIGACNNNRDKAIIAIMYESGCRLGELLSSRIKHIEFTSFGCNMTFPEGKTGSRTVPLVYSRSYIQQWLDCHPQKQDNNAYLLVSVYQNGDSYRKMTEHGLYMEIKKIARRAGITKNVFPHLMRHSRASVLAEHMTDQQMKQYLGWTKSSSMPSVYVHDPQVENSILKMYGITPEEQKQDNLKVIKCQNCKEYKPAIEMYCSKCGFPLSEKARLAQEEAQRQAEIAKLAEITASLKAEIEARLKAEMDANRQTIANEVSRQLSLANDLSFIAELKKLSDPTSEHYDPQRAIKMTSGNFEMIKDVAKIDDKYLYEMKRKKK